MEMSQDVVSAPRQWRRRWARAGLAVALACASVAVPRAAAASLSPRALRIIGQAVQFLQPPVRPGTMAIAYDPARPASRADATAMAPELGSDLVSGGTMLPMRVVAVAELPNGRFVVAIVAAGAGNAAFGAAIRAAHMLCVTADMSAVPAEACTMAVVTRPRVEVVLNHAAANACGVDFSIAFRMMIREI
jgi:hypothetical protein